MPGPSWLPIVLAIIGGTFTLTAAVVAAVTTLRANRVTSAVDITRLQHEQWQKMLTDERAGRAEDKARHDAELLAIDHQHDAELAAMKAECAAEVAELEAVIAGQAATIESLTDRRGGRK